MKKVLLLLATVMTAMSLWAAPVNLSTAKAKAQNYLVKEMYAGRIMSPAALEPVLLKAEMGLLNQPVFYIFNTESTFIVVAGDDRADEILMIGDRPLRNIDNLPLGLRDMLGQYKDQIMYLQKNPDMEANLLANPSSRGAKASVTGTYGPLLTCNWDQEAPYNNLCKFGSYTCLTGCPATSASMVFYHWKYPTAATPVVPGYKSTISYSSYGSKSYTHSALPSVTFDWANMLDSYTGSYTTAQGNAVATLMRYVGQAERMGYGTSAAGGSGVSVDSVCNIRDAFIFFGYDPNTTRFVKKTSAYSGGTTLYSDSQWAALIQEEIAAGRPIVFCAVSSNAGGHAFNVDGYNSSTNKYHVNFGWSGDGNAWCSLNSFGYSSYNFNVYQQMVIGIQPPTSSATPTLSVSPSTLSFSATAGQTVSKTFTVTGANLQGNVTLSLTDANGVYSISPSTISASAAASGATVTVTYAPTAAGSHSASIKLSSTGASNVSVSMSGTAAAAALETYTPVMSAANSSYITSSSFRANWSDQTPSANVASYTLQVDEQGSTPATTELANINLSNVSAVTTSDGYLSNIASSITSYLGTGWTASTYAYANTGMLITKGNFVSPSYSLTGYSKVTVKVKAQSYYSSYYGNATLSVSTGSASKTQALTDNMTEYTFVLDCASSSKVTIGSTSNYIAVSSIQIYAGDATSVNMLAASETGGQTTRTITGITNKYYTVSNLKTGATFNYKVKAIYTDGSESSWSNVQSVTLSEEAPAATPTLTVSKTSLSLATDLGETATATFKVTGADLTGNVTLKLTDNNGVYSITPTTITAANAANGVNVTVTYNPAAAGSHTGTITVASTGAESKTVALTGTATINKATPVMNSATGISSTAFTANWTHNVLTAGVSSYSLYVNLVSQPSEPEDPEEPESTLLASLDGSQYTGSYKTITLKSPWGGSNVKGGNGAVYTKNSSSWWWSSSTTYGTITYTVPSGYSNATFTVQVTTSSNSYGSGNVTVKSAKTSAVGHSFSKGETYSWTVTASAGDKITIYSTSSNYSPDMTMINIYAGTPSLNATQTGDNTALTITGIAAGETEYVVNNLIAGATYSYYLVAKYIDGTTATSNTQQVTLTSMNAQGGGTTAIDAITGGDEVVSVTYVNMAGVQRSEPWDGVNVRVVRYKNGTVKSTKIVR